MNESDTETKNEGDYIRFLGGFALFGLLSAATAVSGLFFRPVIATVALFFLVPALFFLFRAIANDDRTARITLLLSVAVTVVLLVGTTPFLFSGRDQGSIAEAAVLLSREGGLHFSSTLSDIFFRIYGPGQALHFPGFHYATDGSLVTQFPIGTVSSFGAFVSLFGTYGLIIGSGGFLVFSLFFLFLVVRDLTDRRFAFGAFLVGATSFLPLFVARLPLSENLFLALFLMLSFSISRFLRTPNRRILLTSLFLVALLSIIRIEGVFTFVATLAILVLSAPGRTYFDRERSEFQLSILVLSLLFLAANLAMNLALYRSVIGATLDHITAFSASVRGDAPAAIALWRLFLPYGLFLPFLFGLMGMVFLAVRKRWDALIPAALALPTFLFLVDPNISPDHPWMLRRFLFSLWPTFMIAFPTALFLLVGHVKQRRAASVLTTAVFAMVILSSLPATLTLFSFREYEGLSAQADRLAGKIGERDLLLLDREAVGDPYAIPAAPLRLSDGRSAVYFFNPADYGKIPTDAFDRIYLLAPESNANGLWSGLPAMLVPVDTVRFTFERFRPTSIAEPALPERETVTSESILYRLDPFPSPAI